MKSMKRTNSEFRSRKISLIQDVSLIESELNHTNNYNRSQKQEDVKSIDQTKKVIQIKRNKRTKTTIKTNPFQNLQINRNKDNEHKSLQKLDFDDKEIVDLYSKKPAKKNESGIIYYEELKINKEIDDHIEKNLNNCFGSQDKKFKFEYKRCLRRSHAKVEDSLEDEDDEDLAMIAESKTGYIINKDSNAYIILDNLLTISIIFTIFLNPLELAFGEENILFLDILKVIFDLILMGSLIINFFTPFNNKFDDLVMSNRFICLNYLLGRFFYDLVYCIPSNIFLIGLQKKTKIPEGYYFVIKSLKILSVFRIFDIKRLIKLFTIFNYLKLRKMYTKHFYFRVSRIMRVTHFLFLFSLLSHIFSCIWAYLATINPNYNWVIKSDLNLLPNHGIYISSLYYFCATIFTVGYGDITPSNTNEYIFTIILMMFGVFLYSFAVSSLGAMILSHQQATILHHKKMDILHDIKANYPLIDERPDKGLGYLDNKFDELKNETLFDSIQKFLHYDYKKNKAFSKEFINELPVKIKNDMVQQMYNELVQNFCFFKITNTKNTSFITTIIFSMKPLRVYRKFFIYTEGDYVSEMFFVKTGKLSISMTSEFNNEPLFTLKKNDYFGVVNALYDEKCNINIKVKSAIAELLTVNKNDLFQIFIKFSDIFKEIFKISLLNYIQIQEIVEEKKEKHLKLKNKLSNSLDSFEKKPKLSKLYGLSESKIDINPPLVKDIGKTINEINHDNSGLNLIENKVLRENINNIISNNPKMYENRPINFNIYVNNNTYISNKFINQINLEHLTNHKEIVIKQTESEENKSSKNPTENIKLNEILKKKSRITDTKNFERESILIINKNEKMNTRRTLDKIHLDNIRKCQKKKSMVMNISSKVKSNFNKNIQFERNPKYFVFEEFQMAFKKYLDKERNEFSDYYQKLEKIEKQLSEHINK